MNNEGELLHGFGGEDGHGHHHSIVLSAESLETLQQIHDASQGTEHHYVQQMIGEDGQPIHVEYGEEVDEDGVETQVIHDDGDEENTQLIHHHHEGHGHHEEEEEEDTQLIHEEMEGQEEEEVDDEGIHHGHEGHHHHGVHGHHHRGETQIIIHHDGGEHSHLDPGDVGDLITFHAMDEHGNLIHTNSMLGGDEGQEEVDHEGYHHQDQETAEHEEEDQYQDEEETQELESMDHDQDDQEPDQDESMDSASDDHHHQDQSHTKFTGTKNSDLLTTDGSEFVSGAGQRLIFNPVTGTLQPVPVTNTTASSNNTASTPTQQKAPTPSKSKKKAPQAKQIKYVLAATSELNHPSQQVLLDPSALQGLLQGTAGGNITLTGVGVSTSGRSKSTQKKTPAGTVRGPTKILPAPVPAGDQQQSGTVVTTPTQPQRILFKQGTVLTPIGGLPQQGGSPKYIQIPSSSGTGSQYLRIVSKQTPPSNKIPIAPSTSKPKSATPKSAPVQNSTSTPLPSGMSDLSTFQQNSGNFVVVPNYTGSGSPKKNETSSPSPMRSSGHHASTDSILGSHQSLTHHLSQLGQTPGSLDSIKSLLEPNGMRPRKPCNCNKSQCLKLYCDCFANGEFCHLCNCTNCSNNLTHEEERQKAIKLVLERNPGAFRPKIGKSSQTGEAHERRHNKGCNCRRSGCLKNYCECYEAKIFCSGICKCSGCKNCIENIPSGLPNGVGVEQHFAGAGTSHRQTLKDLAEAAEVRVQQQTSVKNKMKAQLQDIPTQNNLGIMVPPVVFRYPQGSISYEVVTSTVELLLAKAEAGEKLRIPEGELEKHILEEFGDCLAAVMELGSTVGVD